MQATAAATMLSQLAPRFVGGGGHQHSRSTAAPRGAVTTNGAAITGGGGGGGGGLPFAARSRYAASVAPFRGGGGGNRKAAAAAAAAAAATTSHHRRGGHRHRRRGSSIAPSASSASDSATGGGGEVEKTEDGTAVYPLNSAGRGWDPAEMHKLTGMVWAFTTPSSTDGRKIVKYSCEQAGVKLKGASNWRKEDWENAAKEAGVTFLDTYSSLSGMRGFRAVWAPHGIALLYVPGVRRFYTMEDVMNGAANDKAEKDTAGVVAALEALGRVNPGFGEAYKIAVDPTAAQVAAAALQNIAPGSPEFSTAMGIVTTNGMQLLVRRYATGPTGDPEYNNPKSCIARWCVGGGVDAPALYLEYGVGFDFHGPAGIVSRGVIAAVADFGGEPLDADAELSWAKQQWVEAMETLGVTYVASHAPLASIGRGWKVCWVADAVEKGCPAAGAPTRLFTRTAVYVFTPNDSF